MRFKVAINYRIVHTVETDDIPQEDRDRIVREYLPESESDIATYWACERGHKQGEVDDFDVDWIRTDEA